MATFGTIKIKKARDAYGKVRKVIRNKPITESILQSSSRHRPLVPRILVGGGKGMDGMKIGLGSLN